MTYGTLVDELATPRYVDELIETMARRVEATRALREKHERESNAQRNREHDDYDAAILFQDSECGDDDDSSVASNECVWNSEDQPPKWMIEEAMQADSGLASQTVEPRLWAWLDAWPYHSGFVPQYGRKHRPKMCFGCQSLEPNAHCYFIKMTANLTFPVVMTTDEIRRFFKEALIKVYGPGGCCLPSFLVPKCILRAIKEDIVAVEDLVSAVDVV